MACRIGMTTDPDGRRKYWESKHPTLTGWTILGTYYTKSAAQAAESAFAASYGCIAEPGGGGDEHATWSVYIFYY